MKMILPSPQGRNLNKRPGVYSMYRRLFESGVYLKLNLTDSRGNYFWQFRKGSMNHCCTSASIYFVHDS